MTPSGEGGNNILTRLGGVTVTMTSEPPQILVLEDNPAYRNVIAFNLAKAGFRVTVAAESSKALALTEYDHFDLVIADYHLPDHPGTEFIKLLRESDGHRDVPVILLTARAGELDREYLLNEFSALLLAKPCSMAKLVKTVSKFFAMAHAS